MPVYIILDVKGLPVQVISSLNDAAKYLIDHRTIYGPVDFIDNLRP